MDAVVLLIEKFIGHREVFLLGLFIGVGITTAFWFVVWLGK